MSLCYPLQRQRTVNCTGRGRPHYILGMFLFSSHFSVVLVCPPPTRFFSSSAPSSFVADVLSPSFFRYSKHESRTWRLSLNSRTVCFVRLKKTLRLNIWHHHSARDDSALLRGRGWRMTEFPALMHGSMDSLWWTQYWCMDGDVHPPHGWRNGSWKIRQKSIVATQVKSHRIYCYTNLN